MADWEIAMKHGFKIAGFAEAVIIISHFGDEKLELRVWGLYCGVQGQAVTN